MLDDNNQNEGQRAGKLRYEPLYKGGLYDVPDQAEIIDPAVKRQEELDKIRTRAERLQQMTQGQDWAAPDELPEAGEVCPDCQGQGFFILEVPVGHPDFGKPMKCRNPIHQRERANRLAPLCKMNDRQRVLTLDDILPVSIKDSGSNLGAIEGARQFLEKRAGTFFVYGPWGNGKSDLLCALINELEHRTGVRGIYLTLHHLLDFIREAHGEKEALDRGNEELARAFRGKQARWNAIIKTPIIAVDEFDLDEDKLNQTPFVSEQIWRFVEERHQREDDGHGWTILASNSSPESFNGGIRSRLRHSRNIVVQNTAPDMRGELDEIN